MTTPAFKEWRVLVEALGQGGQIVILRKGGIAEGRDGFQVKHERFWLFPTQYHEQLAKTKPEATRFVDAVAREGEVDFRYVADVTDTLWITDWAKLAALDTYHLWREEIIRERFDYDETPGLHVIVVRVFRATEPLWLPMQKAFQGCKSWIEVPSAWPEKTEPVLNDTAFAAQRDGVLAVLR